MDNVLQLVLVERRLYRQKTIFKPHMVIVRLVRNKNHRQRYRAPKSPVKISREFEAFDYAVIKSCKLTSLFLTRFDGVQEIDFLEQDDANEILAYAKEQHKRKKRKKKDMEIIEKPYDELPDDEYEPNGEE